MKSKNLIYSLFLLILMTSCSSNPAEYIAGVFNPSTNVADNPELSNESPISDTPIVKDKSFFDKFS